MGNIFWNLEKSSSNHNWMTWKKCLELVRCKKLLGECGKRRQKKHLGEYFKADIWFYVDWLRYYLSFSLASLSFKHLHLENWFLSSSIKNILSVNKWKCFKLPTFVALRREIVYDERFICFIFTKSCKEELLWLRVLSSCFKIVFRMVREIRTVSC